MRVHLQGKLFGQTVDVPYEPNPAGRADVAERLSNIGNIDYKPGIPDCPGCGSSESKQPTFWTRDLNSALNIRQLALKWMNEKTRPAAFCRAAGFSRTSPTGEEKTGRQVDIRTRRASEPAKKKKPALIIKVYLYNMPE